MAGEPPPLVAVPRVSVCIVSFNTRDLLRECLQSIAGASRDVVDVVVVDNASGDGSAEMVATDFPHVRLVRHPRNIGFAAAANLAMREARGRLFLLLNPDTRLPALGIDALAAFLEARPTAGACGPTLVYPDGTFQCCGYRFPTFWSELREVVGDRVLRGPLRAPRRVPPDRPGDVDWLCGACILVRREAVEQVGVFDEAFYLYGEELDWCARARQAGVRVWTVPSVSVVHHLGQSAATTGSRAHVHLIRTRLQYHRKHHGALCATAVSALYLTRAIGGWLTRRRLAGAEVRAVLGYLRGDVRPLVLPVDRPPAI